LNELRPLLVSQPPTDPVPDWLVSKHFDLIARYEATAAALGSSSLADVKDPLRALDPPKVVTSQAAVASFAVSTVVAVFFCSLALFLSISSAGNSAQALGQPAMFGLGPSTQPVYVPGTAAVASYLPASCYLRLGYRDGTVVLYGPYDWIVRRFNSDGESFPVSEFYNKSPDDPSTREQWEKLYADYPLDPSGGPIDDQNERGFRTIFVRADELGLIDPGSCLSQPERDYFQDLYSSK
jgi:hypothetical protein